MQNTIVSQGQGRPVGGPHFLPWPFSLGSEDHMTQMSAHNTNLALETGRWSWFRSYTWLHYGAETKNPWIFWPVPLWRSRENLRKPQMSPNLVTHLSYLIQYGIAWQKLKTFSPLPIQNSLFQLPLTLELISFHDLSCALNLGAGTHFWGHRYYSGKQKCQK